MGRIEEIRKKTPSGTEHDDVWYLLSQLSADQEAFGKIIKSIESNETNYQINIKCFYLVKARLEELDK